MKKIIYILLALVSIGVSAQTTTLSGIVKIDQTPITVGVDTTAIKMLGRRTSDKRMVGISWAQLKAYFAAGGGVPNLQSVLNVGANATIAAPFNVVSGGGTDVSQINVNENGFQLLHDTKSIIFTDEYHGTNSTFEVEDPIGDKDAVNKQTLESTVAGAPKKDEVRKVICYRLNAIEKEKTDIFVNNSKKVIHISK